ncbi:hypothetical protein AALA22_11715 [Anaerovoracaceae bacterium 41-7]|mgnify:CR=1 FL=1
MTSAVLTAVSDGMTACGLNYALMEWKGKPAYPYFVGEYQETESMTEDGKQECTFILSGFTRRSWADLETAKEKIESYFDRISGKKVIADNGSAVAIFYASSLPVPTGDAELKRIDINLTIKEWKVN